LKEQFEARRQRLLASIATLEMAQSELQIRVLGETAAAIVHMHAFSNDELLSSLPSIVNSLLKSLMVNNSIASDFTLCVESTFFYSI
jgi:hypothetical protein